MEHRVVVVVGAGPAGLATAASLHARGVFPLVLDRSDGVGPAWRTRRYDRLRLHTVRWLSHLPGYPRSYGKWASGAGTVERPIVHGAESHPAAYGLDFVGVGVELGGLLRRIRFDARAPAAAIATRLGRERPGAS